MWWNSMRALLIVLGVVAVVGASAPTRAEEVGQMAALNPQNLAFTPIPDMPICATAAIIRGNPRSGPAWVYLKLRSGCRVPAHWHTANEELVLISGQGKLTMRDGPSVPFVPGAFASLPSHHVHQADCTRSCLFFSIADASFDIHYVDAKGEELSPEQAVKQSEKTRKKKLR